MVERSVVCLVGCYKCMSTRPLQMHSSYNKIVNSQIYLRETIASKTHLCCNKDIFSLYSTRIDYFLEYVTDFSLVPVGERRIKQPIATVERRFDGRLYIIGVGLKIVKL